MHYRKYFVMDAPGGQIPERIRKLSFYHFVRLDTDTIMGVADFPENALVDAEEDESCLVFGLQDAPLSPSAQPKFKLPRPGKQLPAEKIEARRQKHLAKLSAEVGAQAQDAGVDVVAKVFQKFGFPPLLPNA